MSVHGAREQIHEAVLSWPGVTTGPSRFGGIEYRLGKREIGHIHGDYLLDIRFPKKIRDDIVAAGRARPHHILPKSGWISFYINEPNDIEPAIGLLRESFELLEGQSNSPLDPRPWEAKRRAAKPLGRAARRSKGGSKTVKKGNNTRNGAKRNDA